MLQLPRLRSEKQRHVHTKSQSAWAKAPGVTVCASSVWRSVKYEEIYPRAYDSVSEAGASIGRYLDF
jgi:hypothetical protein